ncbi:MAG TPA: ABC transporter ATP-binding protein [Bacteroidia bacterium]|nr:ABC transporter ATP-binding protein [Bacteroidia bacterium]HRB96888.1 ABC transporter ATP-binding protein [Nitrosomonas sp.]MBP7715235.1 ABC transporter ATP-binding protein [Bacteroidia bacterium]HOZ89910.1 ABC transporter ATP-binding protein [Bacteroidia bacterium]HQW18797.1 ABC transporter ATP-binding protein [Bacteroidia bacterium]
MDVLTVSSLSYTYKNSDHAVLSNINLHVGKGEVFGVFGPNGAGKTTLLSLVTGILTCRLGVISILGKDASTQRKNVNQIIGYVPQDFAFYEELSAIENLIFFGAMYGLKEQALDNRAKELLEEFGLMNVAERYVKEFSGGMKRRLNIAIGLLHKPQLLILDEPTVGVDVQSRLAIMSYLKKINSEGTTIIYTSHLLKEAEEFCSRIALIDKGKVIAIDTIANLLIQNQCKSLEEVFIKLTGNNYRD